LSTGAIIGVSVAAVAGSGIVVGVVVLIIRSAAQASAAASAAIPTSALAANVGATPNHPVYSSHWMGHRDNGYENYGYHPKFSRPPQPMQFQ
jgi:hypothetical protein